MSNTMMESTRQMHQEIEMLLDAAAQDLMKPKQKVRERINRDQLVKQRVNRILEVESRLLELYSEDNLQRQRELSEFSGANGDVMSSFYGKIKDIRNYHRQFSNAHMTSNNMSDDMKVTTDFKPEEYGGRLIDLHPIHSLYLNMKMHDRLSYVKFLGKFEHFYHTKEQKINSFQGEYETYLTTLENYLWDFFSKSYPLASVSEMKGMIEEEFEKKWATKSFPGWQDEKEDAAALQNPLFCKACDKLFSKEGTFDNHLRGKKHKRAQKKLDATGGEAEGVSVHKQKKDNLSRKLALMEENIHRAADLLRDRINDTQQYIEMKQTRTQAEIMADMETEMDETILSSDEEEDDGPIYNPLNLPLGWDGKPIPFWLYKLHGLSQEYKCEICGDYSYWGPLAFSRHFKEWRHAYGMRCLGIPNTSHFQGITTFADAKALHEKLLANSQTNQWDPETQEEFEDLDGNVFNKKTYDDLRRQGIV